jgi:hypothetical protein
VLGVVGGILNTVVFLSLRTFRENACAFYLLVLSIVNVGQLVTGLLPLIMTSAFNIDWTKTSLFYCKFRLVVFQFCVYVSYSCLCFATIDQYFATCSRPRWSRWSNIKLARRLTCGAIVIWALHGIPYGLFLGHVVSPITKVISCVTTNHIFAQYRAYGASLTLIGVFPVTFTAVFGFLAYRNIKHLDYRTIPLVRQALDKQLTVMVLAQVILNCFTDIPYELSNALTIIPNIASDAIVWAKLQSAYSITLVCFYAYFAVSTQKADGPSGELKGKFDPLLESILHLHLCIGTISSTINACCIRNSSESISSTSNNDESSETRRIERRNKTTWKPA